MHSNCHNIKLEVLKYEIEDHGEDISAIAFHKVVVAKAQYSASNEECESVSCFFMCHEMRDLPMKKHWSNEDLCMSAQSAHSAFEKPITACENLLKRIIHEQGISLSI